MQVRAPGPPLAPLRENSLPYMERFLLWVGSFTGVVGWCITPSLPLNPCSSVISLVLLRVLHSPLFISRSYYTIGYTLSLCLSRTTSSYQGASSLRSDRALVVAAAPPQATPSSCLVPTGDDTLAPLAPSHGHTTPWSLPLNRRPSGLSVCVSSLPLLQPVSTPTASPPASRLFVSMGCTVSLNHAYTCSPIKWWVLAMLAARASARGSGPPQERTLDVLRSLRPV